MKRFLKHNIVLVVVLGISLIAALALLVWTAMEYIQMSRYIRETNQLRNDIATLIKKVPAPVEGNKPRIEADKVRYEKSAQDIRRRFGHPMQPALDGFVAELKTLDGKDITLKEFKDKFFENWSNDKSTADQGVDYKTFQRNFRNWARAMAVFRQRAASLTAEPITDNNIDDIFLVALGVPRKLDGKSDNLLRFMLEFRSKLLEICKDKVEFDTLEARNFSFTLPTPGANPAAGQGGYQPEDYPMITRNWEILGDIVKRSAASGITSFGSFRHRSIQPDRNGSFYVFHFSIEVTGTLDSIRQMVSLLDKAYAENRVYVVRSIFLYQPNDVARELIEPAGLPEFDTEQHGMNMPPPEIAPGPVRRGSSRRNRLQEQQPQELTREERIKRQEEERKAQLEAEKSRPYYARTGYGNNLAGGQDTCRAIIDVQYVMEADN